MKKLISIIALVFVTSLEVLAQNIPHPNISAARDLAVNSYTGNLFYQRNEQNLRGTGYKIFQSFYYSAAQDTLNYGYGHGWSFYYHIFYKQSGDTVTIHHADAKKDQYLLVNGNFQSPAGVSDILTKNGTQFILSSKDGKRQFFNNAVHKKITRMEDRNGNFVTLEYSGEHPVKITNSTGRNLILEWENDLLMSAKDAAEPAKKYSYAYNESNDLISVTDPLDGKKTFLYDHHFLVGLSDENGNPIGINYAGTGGKVRQITTCQTELRFTFLDSVKKTFVTRKALSGGITQGYHFDNDGKLIATVNHEGNKQEFNYDKSNNLIEWKNLSGLSTRYDYDERGNMLRETDVAGNVVSYTYEPKLNLPLMIKDKRGNLTQMSYDSKGNLLKIQNPDGGIIMYTYDALGRKLTEKDANNNQTSFHYNADGDLEKVQYPAGMVRFQYNGSCCSVGKITSANGNSLELTYDLLNRSKGIKDDLGNITAFDYDKNGNVIKETDAAGNKKIYGYDGLNRLNRVGLSAGSWNYEYDGLGNMIRMTDANGHSVYYDYNKNNQLSVETDAIGNATRYSYDLSGNLIKRANPDGNTVAYSYDILNRLIEKAYNGNSDKYGYDEMGNLISAYNDNIAYTFEYDQLNRLIKKNIVTWGKSIQYSYDAVGNRKTMIDSEGGKTSYAYDNANRLVNLTNPAGLTTKFEYDAGGRILKQFNANKTFTTYHYDAGGRMDELVNWKSAAERISFFKYTFDKYGNRLTMIDKHGITTYTYDPDYRLTGIKYADNSIENFELDASGNRTRHLKNDTPVNYVYNNGDQLQKAGETEYLFDANGNTISENGFQQRKFLYDGENRLLNVKVESKDVVQYRYDPFGDKIERIGGDKKSVKMIYDGDNLLSEFDDQSNRIKTYTTGLEIDSWLSVQSGSENVFFHKDGLNSTSELSGINAQLLNQYQYDGYGNLINESGSTQNNIKYTGRIYEQETGLYDYRSRFYNSKVGQFISKDSFRGLLSKTGSLNRYNYVENNPILYNDPSGKSVWETFKRNFDFSKNIRDGVNQASDVNEFNKAADCVAKKNVPEKNHTKDWASIDYTGNFDEGYRQIDERNQYGKHLVIKGTAVVPYYPEINDTGKSPCEPDDPKKGPDDPIKSPQDAPIPVKFPTLAPSDPNEIIGPAGFDTVRRIVSVRQTLAYKVLFENDPIFATAPAQQVTVYVPIDEKLNPASVRIGDFGFGSFNFKVPLNSSIYTNRLDLRDSLGLFVDVTAGLDLTKRRVFWIFQSIDPATGLSSTLPADIGFLLVNDTTTHAGEGYVNFTALPIADALSRDSVLAKAAIIFDTEETISTNLWRNTIDALAPVTKVTGSEIQSSDIKLKWSGKDNVGGSGIRSYALYVAENGGPYKFHKDNIQDSTLLFRGNYATKYDFYIIATDNVGNKEALKNKADFSVDLRAEKITQKITFEPLSAMTYGDGDKDLIGKSSSGLPVIYKSSDPSLAYITPEGKIHVLKAGDVTITAQEPGNDIYKPAISISRKLVIVKKELQVTVSGKSRSYGAINPEFEVNFKGFVNGDDQSILTSSVEVSTNATKDSQVGEYTITAKGGKALNYNLIYTDGILSVTKTLLEITAESKTRAYNSVNPVFTFSYSGFVNNQTVSVFQNPPQAFTQADQVSPVGTYSIAVGGATAANYQIKFISGVLTVTPAKRTLTFPDIPGKTYGDPDFNLEAATSSDEILIWSSSDPRLLELTNGRAQIKGAGTVILTATLPPNPNYIGDNDSKSREVKISKASQKINFLPIPDLQRRGKDYTIEVSSTSGLPVTLNLNETIAVELRGMVLKPLRVGRAVVTAVQPGNENYFPADPVAIDFRITDEMDTKVRVHPAVSPDGDGVNDFLVIEGISDYPDNQITIVSRNGAKVYQTKGYDNKRNVFNGKNSSGENLIQGTYFYSLEYIDGGKKQIRGGYFVIKY